MSRHKPTGINPALTAGVRIAIVAARFNSHIVDGLLSGCLEQLEALGVAKNRVQIHRVPGAFEIPLAAQTLARTEKFSAVICLGAVIRGDTPHFDFVAGECARGIQNVALAENLPIIFSVLTTNTEQQALDRIGRPKKSSGKSRIHAGRAAAEAACEMIAFQHDANRIE
jgi:6,7-dimethyl-8-ribityllumazine synthase